MTVARFCVREPFPVGVRLTRRKARRIGDPGARQWRTSS